jgi:hypothetical protein
VSFGVSSDNLGLVVNYCAEIYGGLEVSAFLPWLCVEAEDPPIKKRAIPAGIALLILHSTFEASLNSLTSVNCYD